MGHGSFTVQALFMAANEMWLHLSFLCLKVAGGNLQAQLCFLWNVNCVICSQLTPGKSVQWTRGSECHFSHASVTRFRQAFVTLVAGSWIHPGEACVVQVPVIQFDSLNCIVLELRVLANHDNIRAVVLKQLVLKALIGAPAHDFDYSNSIVSIVSFVSKQIWKQVMLHAEKHDMLFQGQPNEQQQTHNNFISNLCLRARLLCNTCRLSGAHRWASGQGKRNRSLDRTWNKRNWAVGSFIILFQECQKINPNVVTRIWE